VPYTFGAGTGDDITWAILGSFSQGSTAGLVCGWWYPTTLTATRGLWSLGNTFGAEIDATTDELRLRTDNTTDGQWTTAGVDLAVNNWKFIAFLGTFNNTGPAAAWRVWAGSVDSAPIECTVTSAVAPVGNFVVNGNFYMGNKGTGALAFQGAIGDVSIHSTSAAGGVTAHPFSLATLGAITNAEALFVYERFVLPIWAGNGFRQSGALRRNGAFNASNDDILYACTTNQFQIRRTNLVNNTTFSGITPTINGATYSQNGSPRPLLSDSPYMPAVRR
jgi:hypothetical protein